MNVPSQSIPVHLTDLRNFPLRNPMYITRNTNNCPLFTDKFTQPVEHIVLYLHAADEGGGALEPDVGEAGGGRSGVE